MARLERAIPSPTPTPLPGHAIPATPSLKDDDFANKLANTLHSIKKVAAVPKAAGEAEAGVEKVEEKKRRIDGMPPIQWNHRKCNCLCGCTNYHSSHLYVPIAVFLTKF